jgi:hypothetical protein
MSNYRRFLQAMTLLSLEKKARCEKCTRKVKRTAKVEAKELLRKKKPTKKKSGLYF